MKTKQPSVRIVRPAGRTLQLRYTDPGTGKEVRISTGTHDMKQAEKEKRALLRELKHGDRPRPLKPVRKGSLSWDEFRERYRSLKKFRTSAGRQHAETSLDICEGVVQPKRLRDMTDTSTLMELQARLARTRSAHSVASYMRTLKAALNWAYKMGWLLERVRFEMIATIETETTKGHWITEGQFQLMLEAVDEVCKNGAPNEWKRLLQGIWHSGLRLSEALSMTWDEPNTIRPLRHRSGHVMLEIPGSMQKNKKSQTIPCTPQFAALLAETPQEQRTGRIFQPQRLRGTGCHVGHKQVGNIIARIAKHAGLTAGAHDLRRSFGQRLADAGVSRNDLQSIMRHSDWKTTEKYYLRHNASDQADRIAAALGYGGAECTHVSEDMEKPQVPK